MLAKVQKWGNSQGIRVPKAMLEQLDIHIGDEINLSVEEGKLILEPSRKRSRGLKIEHLVAEMPADYVVEEADWGKSVGKEAW